MRSEVLFFKGQFEVTGGEGGTRAERVIRGYFIHSGEKIMKLPSRLGDVKWRGRDGYC